MRAWGNIYLERAGLIGLGRVVADHDTCVSNWGTCQNVYDLTSEAAYLMVNVGGTRMSLVWNCVGRKV